MDIFTQEKRSQIMSRVRCGNTKPELKLRQVLHGLKYRYRLHSKELPGKPDIVFPKFRKVIFVNGCFWHQHPGCKKAALPRTNHSYWEEKLANNVKRDAATIDKLAKIGWATMVVWECELKNLDEVTHRVEKYLRGCQPT
ncbi:very short patch repair endonuclease [Rhizobium hidalgonense]|uniref:very short patch repair endonuclease n=1 Tax=Rhizobium hidalgonense TaxID=1538159 RepID=UPI00245348AF|nr:very short patch repair endonuclease [Rhizobium hidalgonense]